MKLIVLYMAKKKDVDAYVLLNQGYEKNEDKYVQGIVKK